MCIKHRSRQSLQQDHRDCPNYLFITGILLQEGSKTNKHIKEANMKFWASECTLYKQNLFMTVLFRTMVNCILDTFPVQKSTLSRMVAVLSDYARFGAE